MRAVTYFQDLLHALEDDGLWSGIDEPRKRALIQALDAGEDVTWAAGGAWRADGEGQPTHLVTHTASRTVAHGVG
jgi:hypothetical protein